MSQIRLRYTGITAYASSLVTTLTGLLFTLLITRRLLPEELGVWRYIGSLVAYFVIPPGIVSYWTTRMTAQGKRVLATSLSISSLSALATTTFFIALSEDLGKQVNTPYIVFVIAAIEIPLISAYMVLEAALTARRPERAYYAIMIQEFVKLPIAVALLLFLKLGLLGAILAAIAGYAARVTASFLFVRGIGLGRVEWSTASRILSRAWLPLYSGLQNYIAELQFIVVVLIVGSAEVLGYASAVLLIGSIVAMSGNLSAGLYPKLLQSQSSGAVEISLKMVLMMAIPTSVGAFVLSEHILNILRPEYKAAAPILLIALPGALVYLVNNIIDVALTGQERADFDDSADFKRLVRSRLFLTPTINIVQSVAYITTLIPILFYFSRSDVTLIVAAWFTTALVLQIPFLIYKIKISGQIRALRKIAAPFSRYLLSSAVMGVVVYALRPLSTPIEVTSAMLQLLPSVVAGISTYFVTLFLTDMEFRGLIGAIGKSMGLRYNR
jgi:hypothetical protein